MGLVKFKKVAVEDANEVVQGRGDIKDQLARITTDLGNVETLVNELKTDFNNHVHACDGAEAGAYYSSIPDGSAAGKTGAAPRAIAAADVAVTAK